MKYTDPQETNITIEDIRRRKQSVLTDLRKEQALMRLYSGEILQPYERPKKFFSLSNVTRVIGVAGNIRYAYKIFRAIQEVRSGLHKR